MTILPSPKTASGSFPQTKLRPLQLLCFVAIISCCIAHPLSAQVSVLHPTSGSMKIRLDGETITAEIRNILLQQVLEELAARTGIVFEIGSQENPAITLNLYQVTLQEAVQRIIGSNNAMLFYGRDAAGESRIQLVRIYSRTNKSAQPSLRDIGSGTITKTNEDTIENAEQALKALAENQKVDVRQKAVDILVTAKGEVAIQALTKALGDSAAEVRVAAIEGLASLGARNSLAQILACLKDSHPGVRQSAITAVAWLGDAENVKDLRPMIKDPDVSVAAAAEVALKKLAARKP